MMKMPYRTFCSTNLSSKLITKMKQVLTVIASLTVAPIAFAATANGIGYVPIDLDNKVAVIDTTQQKLIKTIPVGSHPIVIKAFPDRSKVYVDNFGPLSSYMSVIDTKTDQVTKNIYTNGAPYAAMELTANGRYMYIPTDASVIHVVDTKTDTIIKTFGTAALPISITLSKDEQSLYVFFADGTAAAYSTMNGALVKPKISLKGLAPGWGVLSKDGSKLYSLNALSDNLTIIDTTTWKVIGLIGLGFYSLPLSGTLTPDGNYMYVCNIGSYTMSVIDVRTDKIVKVIKTAQTPIHVSFNATGSRAFLSNLGNYSTIPTYLRPYLFDIFYFLPPGLSGYVTTYDTQSATPVGKIWVGNGPAAGTYFF